LNKELAKKIAFDGINGNSTDLIEEPTFEQMNKLAIQNADGVVFAQEDVDALRSFAEELGRTTMDHPDEDFVDAYLKFYSELLVEETVA